MPRPPARAPARRALAATVAVVAATSVGGCGAVSMFVSREGNIAFGPRNAATGPPGVAARFADEPHAPRPHVARSAFDRWRPPPLGILPPGNLLRNTSEPVHLDAGPLRVTLRGCDRLVPSWGGDTYVRVELRARGSAERAPPRDLVAVIDTRGGGPSVERARHLAASLFETLRADDRGGLVATTEWGRVLVPLLSYGAAPLLIDRTRTFEPRGGDDLGAALEHALPLLAGDGAGRIRRLVVFSGSAGIVQADAVEALQLAARTGTEVFVVPLEAAAATRLRPLELRAPGTVVLPELRATDEAQTEAIDELAALPPSELVARDVALVVDALPGPSHLIEVAGAQAEWTPSGGEVPIGAVRAADRRTLVVRAAVPAYRSGAPFELSVGIRWRDGTGPHELRRVLRAEYTASPRQWAGSRAGDVLQYVSLLNTLSNVQAAIARRDDATLASLRDPAALQGRSLEYFARTNHDAVMSEQASLLLELLSVPMAPWQLRRPARAAAGAQRGQAD